MQQTAKCCVPLRALLDQVGVPSGERLRGPEMRTYIAISAKDGYEVVLALAEIDPMFQPESGSGGRHAGWQAAG